MISLANKQTERFEYSVIKGTPFLPTSLPGQETYYLCSLFWLSTAGLQKLLRCSSLKRQPIVRSPDVMAQKFMGDSFVPSATEGFAWWHSTLRVWRVHNSSLILLDRDGKKHELSRICQQKFPLKASLGWQCQRRWTSYIKTLRSQKRILRDRKEKPRDK